MPPAKKAVAKSKKPARKSRVPRALNTTPEFASCVATTTIQGLGTGTIQSYINCALDQFTRPVSIARNYQMYRIPKIELRFKPQYDTFISGNGATLVPYLHYIIDKSGSVPTNVGLSNLIQMGAKPIRFDDKTIVRSYAPTVLTDNLRDLSVTSTPASYRTSPWLVTNYNVSAPNAWTPSSVNHYGIYFCVAHNGTSQFAYDVEVTVHFQFKKQLVNATGQVAATPIIIEGGDGQDGALVDPLQ